MTSLISIELLNVRSIQDLTTDLHASLGTIQWVSTGYLLAMLGSGGIGRQDPVAGVAVDVLARIDLVAALAHHDLSDDEDSG